MSGAHERAGEGPQFCHHRGADFAGKSRLVEVREKKTADAAGSKLPREIGIVDVVSDAVSKFLRRLIQPVRVATNRRLRGLFASCAG